MLFVKFILAFLVALCGSWWPLGKFWPRVTGFALLLWSFLCGQRASEEVYHRRMASCQQCPLFYRPLETCGSPLTKDADLGCWCFLPFKNLIPGARCWLRDNAPKSLYGWPEELNG